TTAEVGGDGIVAWRNGGAHIGRRARTAAANELYSRGDDLRRESLLALLVLPLARLDAPFNADLATLRQVLAGDLGLLAEHDHAMPLGRLLLLAVPIGPALGRRDSQIRDGLAALGETHLRIGSQIANQDHFVHGMVSGGGRHRCVRSRA